MRSPNDAIVSTTSSGRRRTSWRRTVRRWRSGSRSCPPARSRGARSGPRPRPGPTVSRIWPVHSRSKVRAWIRTACGPRSASRSEARANRKSPVRMATVLSQRAFAEAAPRRSGASSMTSSWYRVARWVSSTTTAEGTTPDATGSPNCAASRVSSGRKRLPPASTRWRAALVTNGYSLTTDWRSRPSTSASRIPTWASSPASGRSSPSGRLEVREGTGQVWPTPPVCAESPPPRTLRRHPVQDRVRQLLAQGRTLVRWWAAPRGRIEARGGLEVDHAAVQVGVVGREVEVAVPGQGDEDHPIVAGLRGPVRLADRRGDRVAGLGCRHDPLGAREPHRGVEALHLRHRLGLEQPQLVGVRQQRRHPVVAQATGVDGVGDEVVPERVHLHQRGHARTRRRSRRRTPHGSATGSWRARPRG